MGRKRVSVEQKSAPVRAAGMLAQLGLVGMEAIEPVVIAALMQRDPLLLIGPHGTGKSYLLNRLAAALKLDHRHYNASLMSFDDLVGYPLPNGSGSLEYVQTPASIWGAQSAFLDEISRCRPEVQNKLFSIIHERRVQGLLLERLVYRWSAMNPPAGEEGNDQYAGSEPLDAALADRFAFVVEIPDWRGLSPERQEELILTTDAQPSPEVERELSGRVEAGRQLAAALRETMGAQLARYVRLVCALLAQAGLPLSPRRAVMLVSNIVYVHAARCIDRADADAAVSAFTALRNSLPQRACGLRIKEANVLAAHKEAWRNAGVEQDSPTAALMTIQSPLRRALAAIRCEALGKREFSTIVADCLSSLRPGGREAMAAHLFESGAAGRLIAAVAEQAGEWYAAVATPQDVRESVQASAPRHQLWRHVVQRLASLPAEDPDTPAATNLLAGFFGRKTLATERDVDELLEQWRATRREIAEAA